MQQAQGGCLRLRAPVKHLAALYDEAMARFGARCLWNAAPSRSVEGLRVVTDRLRRYGGMDAWRLESRITADLGGQRGASTAP
jgi:hypothetical protein